MQASARGELNLARQPPPSRDGGEAADLAAARPRLTLNEAEALILLSKQQPQTVYGLLRSFQRAPMAARNKSKGGLYPLIRRLERRGLVGSLPLPGGRRGAFRLNCTAAGLRAVRAWALSFDIADVTPDDPLLSRLGALDLLSPTERSAWTARIGALTERKIIELEQEESVGPFERVARDLALVTLRVRMEGLRLLAEQPCLKREQHV